MCTNTNYEQFNRCVIVLFCDNKMDFKFEQGNVKFCVKFDKFITETYQILHRVYGNDTGIAVLMQKGTLSKETEAEFRFVE